MILSMVTMILSMLFHQQVFAAPNKTLSEKFNIQKSNAGIDINDVLSLADKYSDYQTKYERMGVEPASGEIVLYPEDSLCNGNSAVLEEDHEGYDEPAILWDNSSDSYEWTFEVPGDGLYEISADYYPLKGDMSEIQRAVYIDGALPFNEARNIVFPRRFVERGEPFMDANGDEKAPTLEQLYEWSSVLAYDLNGMYPEPLRFYLTGGTHVLRLEYVSGSMALGRITLAVPQAAADYSEIKKQYASGGLSGYKGQPVRKQGEHAEYRSDRILRRTYSSDPSTDPYVFGSIRQNAIGGWYWRQGGDTLTWYIDVPEDGLYKLAARVLQDYENGLTVYRQILVDGMVPFNEFEAYPFHFDTRWRTEELGGDEPYLLWLSRGRHEISMKVVTGEYTPILEELNNINLALSKILRDIMAITTPQPDLNFQYELDKKIPWIMDELKSVRDSLATQSEKLALLSGKRQPIINGLLSASEDISLLVASPDIIPAKLNDLVNLQTNLSTWYRTLQEMPLAVDYFELLSPDDFADDPRTTVWQKIKVTWHNFIRSFTRNYEGITIGAKAGGGRDTPMEEIDVWIARGREWGELLKIMADDDFTPKHNIKVNVNILPSGSVGAIGGVSPLMLSLVTGNAPDAAVGSDQNTPVELAIRDAAEDLSSYPGIEEVLENFLPGAVIPFEYQGGLYALPETMDMPILLYRTDIADMAGLKIPDTWEELYSRTLPAIRQKGLNFYMQSNFSIFLYQNGGRYYTPDGLDTALDSDAAYRAFRQWTRNYTVYRMEASADLFNHFRAGDIPIAIGSLQDYIKLTVAAPELYGRWSIAPIPGMADENGVINRTANGSVTSSMIFSQSDSKEAAWEFLKWWASTETQQRYAAEIEAQAGPEARWLSANREAFKSLSWDIHDLKVITDSWEWFRNPPNVLGGYITQRHVNNAWTRTVLNDMNPRDSFEQAVKDIRNEMKRKHKEYGVEVLP